MGREGYGPALHAAEDLTDGDLLTDTVTKYAERATHAEYRMSHMEAKFEEKFAMMSMQQPLQPTYYQQPPPYPHASYLAQQQKPPLHNPPATINIPAPHPRQQQQSYHPTSKKRERRGKGPRSATEGNIEWNQGGQPHYQQGVQHTGGYGVQGIGGPTPAWQQPKPKVNPGEIYSNTMKLNNNLSY